VGIVGNSAESAKVPQKPFFLILVGIGVVRRKWLVSKDAIRSFGRMHTSGESKPVPIRDLLFDEMH